MVPFKRLRPGDPISASDYNRLLEHVEGLLQFAVVPPLRWIPGYRSQVLAIDPALTAGGTPATTAAIVKVTSDTPTGNYYPAVVESWPGSGWVDGTACLFLPANGETPTVDTRYNSLQVYVDPSTGLTVFSDNLASGGTLTVEGGITSDVVDDVTTISLSDSFILSSSGSGIADIALPIFSGARIVSTGNRIITLPTSITFDQVVSLGTDAYFSVANPTRILIPENGYYFISAAIQIGGTAIHLNNGTSLSFSLVNQANVFLAITYMLLTANMSTEWGQQALVNYLGLFSAGNYFTVNAALEVGATAIAPSVFGDPSGNETMVSIWKVG